MAAAAPTLHQRLSKTSSRNTGIFFAIVLLIGLAFVAWNLVSDLAAQGTTSYRPYTLLVAALLVALGFEFVNGFHDTANAVATVIYTHSLEPNVAVVWSGLWNFIGVLFSSGAVAFGIISLLPVELILQVGSTAGFAMVFALLVAAIVWNLGTWYIGLPSSSSHTLIGSIIGVGLANQLMTPKTGSSSVDWEQTMLVGKSLFLSPLVGFCCAALLLLIARAVIKNPRLYTAPEGTEPPPLWIRALLVLTCTGVSFAHGSNDGQKGMGLIMLILIGTVPTAYALNRAVAPNETAEFLVVSQQAVQVINRHVDREAAMGDAREELTSYIRTRQFHPSTMVALRSLISDVSNELALYKTLAQVPADATRNFRYDMYILGETLRHAIKSGEGNFNEADKKVLADYKRHIDLATRFIPSWVKVAVALALGLGTMVGWKRIVVTVGERIGKKHLTYAQGAAAELTAMATIGAADYYGLPVSTTLILSSGVGGTMAANRAGLQWDTVRNIALAWLLTLPMSMLLAGFLFWVFRGMV